MSDLSVQPVPKNLLGGYAVKKVLSTPSEDKSKGEISITPDKKNYYQENRKKLVAGGAIALSTLILMILAIKKGLVRRLVNKIRGNNDIPSNDLPSSIRRSGFDDVSSPPSPPPGSTGKGNPQGCVNEQYLDSGAINAARTNLRKSIDVYAKKHGYKPVDRYEDIDGKTVHIIYEGFDTDIAENGELIQKVLLRKPLPYGHMRNGVSRADIDSFAKRFGLKPVDRYEVIGGKKVHIIYEGLDIDIAENGEMLQKLLLKVEKGNVEDLNVHSKGSESEVLDATRKPLRLHF